jgi:hypothetical protein
MGVVFGATQQLRGAHFLSHDLWTAAICWFNSLGWYWFAFCRKRKPRGVPGVVEVPRYQANDPESSGSLAAVVTSEK